MKERHGNRSCAVPLTGDHFEQGTEQLPRRISVSVSSGHASRVCSRSMLADGGDQLQRSLRSRCCAPAQHRRHPLVFLHRPTVGKPGENCQISFVDVTDTPYPEITATSRGLADIMYSLADSESVDFLQLLEAAWNSQ